MNPKLKDFLIRNGWKIIIGIFGIYGTYKTMRITLDNTVSKVEAHDFKIAQLEKGQMIMDERNSEVIRRLDKIESKLDRVIFGRRFQ